MSKVVKHRHDLCRVSEQVLGKTVGISQDDLELNPFGPVMEVLPSRSENPQLLYKLRGDSRGDMVIVCIWHNTQVTILD